LRVTLVHNPTAGDERHSRESLVAILADAGHDVIYQSIKDDRWEETLGVDTDLVAVAGGDGTVRKVFKALSGAKTPVTLLPVGSANNIARTLGFEDDDARRLVSGWAEGETRPYDLGRIELAGAVTAFVESSGGGIFAHVLARAKRVDKQGRDKVEHGLRLLRETVEDESARRWELELDGHNISGDLLAVEAMNVRETGPNVLLAPDADPGDGLLDLVLVRAEDRPSLLDYLDGRIENRPIPTPRLPTRRGQQLVVHPPEGAAMRVDDELMAENPEHEGIDAARASIDPSRLTLLLPGAL
jgi:diacylglycerol kinase (ATP)